MKIILVGLTKLPFKYDYTKLIISKIHINSHLWSNSVIYGVLFFFRKSLFPAYINFTVSNFITFLAHSLFFFDFKDHSFLKWVFVRNLSLHKEKLSFKNHLFNKKKIRSRRFRRFKYLWSAAVIVNNHQINTQNDNYLSIDNLDNFCIKLEDLSLFFLKSNFLKKFDLRIKTRRSSRFLEYNSKFFGIFLNLFFYENSILHIHDTFYNFVKINFLWFECFNYWRVLQTKSNKISYGPKIVSLREIRLKRQIFKKEEAWKKIRKRYKNFYLVKTFSQSYHIFWKDLFYDTILCKLVGFDCSLKKSLDIHLLVRIDESIQFESFNLFWAINTNLINFYVSVMLYVVTFKLGLIFIIKPFLGFKAKRKNRKAKNLWHKFLKPTKSAFFAEFKKLKFVLYKLTKLTDLNLTSLLSNMTNNYYANFNGLFFVDYQYEFTKIKEIFEFTDFVQSSPLSLEPSATKQSLIKYTHKKSYVNNFLPVFLLPSVVNFELYKKLNKEVFTFNTRYGSYYINSFLEKLIKVQTLFILKTNLNSIDNDLEQAIHWFNAKVSTYFYKIHVKFSKKFPFFKFVELLIATFLQKDLNIFFKFFKYYLEGIPMKEHKKIFYSFEFLIKKLFGSFLHEFGVKGLKFRASGKISVTGNAKKRSKIIALGAYSLTNKSLKIDYLNDIIRTPTGVLGVYMYLTY